VCELSSWVLEDSGEEFVEEILVFGGGANAEGAGRDVVVL